MTWIIIGGTRGYKVLCQCSCGKRVYVNKYNLRDGKTNGCSDCAKSRKREGMPKCPRCGAKISRHKYQRCKNCASTAQRSFKSSIPKQHYTRLACKVKNAISRCTNEDHQLWEYYGGRGIKVCPEWLSNPKDFLKYLWSLEGAMNDSLELDRVDNDGDYKPGNLRFVTHSESMKNRRARAKDHLGRFLPSELV
jgi:hypothetical protein